jgi:hypothetical protein
LRRGRSTLASKHSALRWQIKLTIKATETPTRCFILWLYIWIFCDKIRKDYTTDVHHYPKVKIGRKKNTELSRALFDLLQGERLCPPDRMLSIHKSCEVALFPTTSFLSEVIGGVRYKALEVCMIPAGIEYLVAFTAKHSTYEKLIAYAPALSAYDRIAIASASLQVKPGSGIYHSCFIFSKDKPTERPWSHLVCRAEDIPDAHLCLLFRTT